MCIPVQVYKWFPGNIINCIKGKPNKILGKAGGGGGGLPCDGDGLASHLWGVVIFLQCN